MDRIEIDELINLALKECHDSITTDWLAYCISIKSKVECIGEKTVVLQKPVTGGLPAVNTYKIIDNDFFQIADDKFKEDYNLLCRSQFSVCIEKVESIKIIDDNNVNVTIKQSFLMFDDLA